MPELPEVEILARHLEGQMRGRSVRAVTVIRPRVIRPHAPGEFSNALRGAAFARLHRRGKFLLFQFRAAGASNPQTLLGHLGMTGRIFLQSKDAPIPRHAVVVLELDRDAWVFEDTRGFGRLTLDLASLTRLGPEPLGQEFSSEFLGAALAKSRQSVKVRLLDQSVVAGLGNIYANEALHQAGISPRRPARHLTKRETRRLHAAIKEVLHRAIEFARDLHLDFRGEGTGDGLFYFGSSASTARTQAQRWRVYQRHGQPCARCGARIRRLVQGGRSSFFCPDCQK